MLLLPTPMLLTSTATVLAAQEYPRIEEEIPDERESTDAANADASLAFVHFVGFWSHFEPDSRRSTWPLPPSKRVHELADFATCHGTLASSPLAGDVFLLGSPAADEQVLAGIVMAVESMRALLDGGTAFVCQTIEGRLGVDGMGDAAPTVVNARIVRRQLSVAYGDRFIRWCELPRQASEVPVESFVPENLVFADGVQEPRQEQEAA